MRKHRGPFPFPTSRFCDVAHIAAFIAAPHPPPHRLRPACDDTHRSTCAPRTPTAASALRLAMRFSHRDGAAECDRRTNRPPPSAQTTRHQYKTESRLTCPPSIARYRLGKRVATLTADAGAGSALPADPSAEVRSPEAAKAELAIRSCPTSLPRLNARAARRTLPGRELAALSSKLVRSLDAGRSAARAGSTRRGSSTTIMTIRVGMTDSRSSAANAILRCWCCR